jgi:hypothetical protein
VTTLLAITAAALAEPRTMREALSTREVERGLLLPKGWVELSAGFDRHRGIGAWSPEGNPEPFDDADWRYDTWRPTVRYGLGPRVELWGQVPFHRARLTNDALGTDTRDSGIGDPRFGARFELYDREPKRTSVALELAYKGPAAQESPGTYIGGPENVSAFVFTTGTPDLSVGLGAKQALGPLALTVHGAYVRRFSAVVQYVVETDELQFLGRIDPGDLWTAAAELGLQLGPLWLAGGPRYTRRGVTRLGVSSAGWSANDRLADVAGSDGDALDLRLCALANVSRGLDVAVWTDRPLAGEDLQFFPIEDLHPTYGPTWGVAVEVRR